MTIDDIKKHLDEKIAEYLDSYKSTLDKTDVKNSVRLNDEVDLRNTISEYKDNINMIIDEFIPLKKPFTSKDGAAKGILYNHVESQYIQFENLLEKFLLKNNKPL